MPPLEEVVFKHIENITSKPPVSGGTKEF